jgi:membrane protease YdiL (CAAX protease family)
MRKSERIVGLVWLGVHAALLPWLIVYVYTNVLRHMNVTMTNASINLVYYAINFAFVMIFMFRFLRTSFSNLLDNPLGALKAIVLAYLFNYAALTLVSLLLGFVFNNTVNPNSQEVVHQTKLDPNSIIVVAVLLVPIVEETLFRGALFGTIRTKSRLLAYVVSTILFSVYHLWQYFLPGFDWRLLLYMLQYIPASLALAWCYEKSGSIWAPIVLHAAINFISIRVTLG